MKNYLKNARNQTHQQIPLAGTNQVRNSAGGYVWEVSIWQRLNRFLILGTEGGSYYASEQALTAENVKALLECIQADGARAVAQIVEISDSGRAAKNDPAIFALALAASHGDEKTRALALAALPQVCRTATHLFSFLSYLKGQRGWGRSLRRAIGDWYTGKKTRDLAYQVIKYRQRAGWTHTDALRKAHPKADNTTTNQILKWVTHRDQATWAAENASPDDEALAFVWAFERAQEATKVDTIVRLIQEYDLPREALPTAWLNTPEVWEALLEKMPMTALIRNLGNMSKVKLLKPGSKAEKHVVAKLTDQKALHTARIHPIALLSALRVYAFGTALKGASMMYGAPNQDWIPVPRVIDALDSAFELAFQNIEPSNKRTMLALDISGSMGMGMVAGVAGLTPREASAAMALVTARSEPDYSVLGFADRLTPLDISAKMRLDDVIARISNLPFGGTDCALPMLHAIKNKQEVDTFVVYTDSETWFGKVHPSQALKQYREWSGIPARLIVVGMLGNRFSIADPDDPGMLDVIGFDAAAPALMAQFARGEV